MPPGREVRNSAGELLHYPPAKITPARPRSPRYLSEQERIVIADLLAAGMTVRGIAAEMGRSLSTVSREMRRNGDPDGRYRPHHAEHAARARSRRPRMRKVTVDAVLAGAVARLLARRWSPEQVAHELRVLFVVSAAGGFVPSRSTRRSMTRRSPSLVRHAAAVAVGVCSACSAAGG